MIIKLDSWHWRFIRFANMGWSKPKDLCSYIRHLILAGIKVLGACFVSLWVTCSLPFIFVVGGEVGAAVGWALFVVPVLVFAWGIERDSKWAYGLVNSVVHAWIIVTKPFKKTKERMEIREPGLFKQYLDSVEDKVCVRVEYE